LIIQIYSELILLKPLENNLETNDMEKRSGNAVTIGNFDGYHLGHQSIIKNTLKISGEKSIGSVLITFNPNPRIFFNSEDKLIYSDKRKKKVLEAAGIKNIEYINFPEIFSLSGRDFIDRFLLDIYNMKYLIVGDNFRLGKGREWDIERISEYGTKKGFKVKVVSSEDYQGITISSSKIRDLLRKGELSVANNMLGGEYLSEGIVMKGDRIGTKLGFPTINIVDNNCLLPDGVYMSRVFFDGDFYKAATYIGKNPTYSKNKTKIETYLFNFDKQIYDKNVEIHFLKFIRGERKFSSEKELISQITDDVEAIEFDFETEV